jgi:transglutaminase-like putative cysteine protease
MKLRTLLFIILLSLSVSLTGLNARPMPRQRIEAQSVPRKPFIQNNSIELDLSYELSVPNQTRRISFVAVLPTTIPDRQKIISTEYSPKPSRTFQSNGNYYAQYVFDNPAEQIKIDIKINMELFKYDLYTAKKNRTTNDSDTSELTDFLVDEKYIEKEDPEIQDIANSLEGRTEEEIVKNIYDFVIAHLEYVKHGRTDFGAVKALREGKGDCSEYSDLFVALCRAKNIPARVVTGYTLRFDSDSPKHNWAEVYLQNYGWVPFEPSWGDVKNIRIQNMAFSRMGPVYVYLSNIRNDDTLQDYHYASYRYWGRKVTLKDSIEIKQLDPLYSN